MGLDASDIDELRRLEESLWRRETRCDPDHMRSITTDELFEFGRSGRTYTRDDLLDIPDQDIPATLPLQGFTVHEVAADVALVTYVSELQLTTLELANRSSLWVHQGGRWRLRFHQGTPVPTAEV
jgi:hypothetical protein